MTDSLQHIDYEELMEIMDNDKDLTKECFNDFIEIYPNMLDNIKNAILHKDSKALEQHAHKLKGSLKNLASINAAELALQLELKGKKGITDNTLEIYEELKTECKNLEQIMINY